MHAPVFSLGALLAGGNYPPKTPLLTGGLPAPRTPLGTPLIPKALGVNPAGIGRNKRCVLLITTCRCISKLVS